MKSIQYIHSAGERIAYEHIPGEGIGIMVVAGHKSEMAKSYKTNALKKLCQKHKIPFTVFDYAGYGDSSGEKGLWLTDIWLQNIFDILEDVVKEPVILVGGSMGGYLMLMVALCIPEKVHGLVGLAAGFGSYKQETGRESICYQDKEIKIGFKDEVTSYHYIYQRLPIKCPIRLVHGLKDDIVPFKCALNIAEQVISEDIQIHLLKKSGHSLQEPEAIKLIWQKIMELR